MGHHLTEDELISLVESIARRPRQVILSCVGAVMAVCVGMAAYSLKN